MKMPEIISRGIYHRWMMQETSLTACAPECLTLPPKPTGNIQKDVEQAVGNYLYSETPPSAYGVC